MVEIIPLFFAGPKNYPATPPFMHRNYPAIFPSEKIIPPNHLSGAEIIPLEPPRGAYENTLFLNHSRTAGYDLGCEASPCRCAPTHNLAAPSTVGAAKRTLVRLLREMGVAEISPLNYLEV